MPKTTLPILSGRSWHPASTQYCVTLRGPLKLALIWHSLVLAVHSSSAGDGLSMQTKYLYLCNVCRPKKIKLLNKFRAMPTQEVRIGSGRIVLDWIGSGCTNAFVAQGISTRSAHILESGRSRCGAREMGVVWALSL